MVANTISRVRPEVAERVLEAPARRPVVLEMKTQAPAARHDGWLLAKPNSPEAQRVDKLINDFSEQPGVTELTDGIMNLLEPEQITTLQEKKKGIDSLGLTDLESKIETTKAMLAIVSDAQAYEIIQNMTEAMTDQYANYDQVMSVIDMYRNQPTADIVDSLVAQLDESGDLRAEKDCSPAKLADPILVA